MVDDNTTNRLLLRETLESWGASVKEAEDGNSGLAELKNAQKRNMPIELALIDCHMPDIDGFMAAKCIKNDPDLTDTIILMLTSDNQKDQVVKARSMGITEYIIKPIKRSDLFNTINRTLEEMKTFKADEISEPDVHSMEKPSQIDNKTQPLRILLVEDDLINQKLALHMLKKQGHQISIANNGREAINIIDLERFDIVLMDVNMPEMDGFEATINIRKKEYETGEHIPIIAMTAPAFEEDMKTIIYPSLYAAMNSLKL